MRIRMFLVQSGGFLKEIAMLLSERSLTRSKKCRRCGETLRNTDVLAVMDDDVVVAAFCCHHGDDPEFVGEIAEEFGIDTDASEEDRDFAVQQDAERQWETYAAYKAAGSVSQYWEDRDAGFV